MLLASSFKEETKKPFPFIDSHTSYWIAPENTDIIVGMPGGPLGCHVVNKTILGPPPKFMVLVTPQEESRVIHCR